MYLFDHLNPVAAQLQQRGVRPVEATAQHKRSLLKQLPGNYSEREIYFQMPKCLRPACPTRLLPLLLLLALPAAVQAQFTYTTNSGALTITGYTGSGGAVTIPSTTNGLPVTSIGDWAFYSRTNLSSVTIPTSITNIGHDAFGQCYGLTGITIPNSVTNIGDWAFWDCSRLTNVAIPNSVMIIGEEVFASCTGLTGITLPNSVVSIGYGAFDDCTSLTNITLPNSVTNIGDYAFSGSYNLKGVYFAGNAPSADSSVFSGDKNATVYYLPRTTGWYTPFGGVVAVPWNPQVQTSGASFGVRTNRFGFTITGSSNLIIMVEASTNVAHPIWLAVGTNTLTGGSSYFSDPQWTNYPARFYRLRSP